VVRRNKHITVFEHQSIKVNDVFNGYKFDVEKLKSLQAFYGQKGVPYFSLINNGVCFNENVGVLQVGDLTIEVLPKADNVGGNHDDKKHWRDLLIDMLLSVGIFDIHAPSTSSLKVKPNSILDLYFGLFVKEVEYLIRNGLIKKYRTTEGNVTALKGSLQFGKHIQENLVHQERFYVKYTTYDAIHKIHSILYQTICLLQKVNTNVDLHSRIGALSLHFPEMPELKVRESSFNFDFNNRKLRDYRKAIEIAKLLLLQYHPDLRTGRNNVLALMFDMNLLWEQFVYRSLSKHGEVGTKIATQVTKSFWRPEVGYRSKIRPDIVVTKDSVGCFVLDTKWKNLNGYNPSLQDLRQMFVYHEYYGAKKVALVYPGTSTNRVNGSYLHPVSGKDVDKKCSVISLNVESKVKDWQISISQEFEKWFKDEV
jgi:5-methylcytosine-specific restriction enzyme subunit McrC